MWSILFTKKGRLCSIVPGSIPVSYVINTITLCVCMPNYEQGVCFFDTAEVYNGGESERLIGEFIRNRRYRSIREKKDKYNDGIHANSDENDDDGDFSSPLLENEGINNYASLDINDATENGDERKGEDMAALLPPSSFRPIVATKFIPLPVPWRGFQSSVMQALYQSLDRLNLPYVDLYQIHGPAFSLRSRSNSCSALYTFTPLYIDRSIILSVATIAIIIIITMNAIIIMYLLGVDVWAEGLVECYEKGLARAVGVSNYNSQEVKTTHRILDEHGVKLASNQIEYSLLHRLPGTFFCVFCLYPCMFCMCVLYHIQTYRLVYLYEYMYAYVCVCMLVRTNTCTHTYMSIYTYSQS